MEPKKGNLNDSKNVEAENVASGTDNEVTNDIKQKSSDNLLANNSEKVIIKTNDENVVSKSSSKNVDTGNDVNNKCKEEKEDKKDDVKIELKDEMNNSKVDTKLNAIAESSPKNGEVNFENCEAKEKTIDQIGNQDKSILIEKKDTETIDIEETIEETIIITGESENSQDTINTDTDSGKEDDTSAKIPDENAEEITDYIEEIDSKSSESFELKSSLTETPESTSDKLITEEDSKKEGDKVVENSSEVVNEKIDSGKESSSKDPKKGDNSTNSDKKRSVIEDIFDDWKDENPDEETGSIKSHDEVEQELKNLLDEGSKQSKVSNVSLETVSTAATAVATTPTTKKLVTPDPSKVDEVKTPKSIDVKSKRTSSVSKQNEKKPLTPKSGVKSTDLKSSPVASTAESTKAFKGFKSKDVESSPKEMIKKTKTNQLNQSKTENLVVDNEKNENKSTDKELLDILEGDVDPDWSNLKSSTLEQPKTGSEQNPVPKLDPILERELALKQLQELPPTPKKPKDKTPKIVKNKTGKDTPKQILNKVFDDNIKDDLKVDKNVSLESVDLDKSQETKADETRSGRKRKPTEKIREQEFNAKRFKLIKPKSAMKKARDSDSNPELNTSAASTPVAEKPKEPEVAKKETSEVVKKEVTEKETKNDEVEMKNEVEESKETLVKKSGQLKTKQKIVKTKVGVKKTPIKTPLKKTQKVTNKPSGKKMTESPPSGDMKEVKHKKKIINEIDRLLQDEGVVNLLYDVEQPRRRRLVPVTQSQAKVMDIQKVKRELKIRTKLVKNAVLRLRTSGTSPNNVTARSTRLTSQNQDQPANINTTPEKTKPTDTMKSPRSSVSSQNEFIIPAKIRNANESVIIRRHSSSSFSSASGSPRVSFDGGEKSHQMDLKKTDDNHSLRSNKRRLSQDDKKKQLLESKKIKKDDDEKSAETVFKGKTTNKLIKKVETKKAKDVDEKKDESMSTSSSSSSISTRSNGATEKNKKLLKSKVSFVDGNEETLVKNHHSEDEDNLSTISLNDSINENINRGKSGNNKKMKTRGSDTDNKNKDKSLFSNKEINVQRHGNLVQLIMTPSTTCKIKNAITLQMMQEFRDILSILKNDNDCKVVLFTSTGTSFCGGLDVSSILQENKEIRRNNALELANGVKEFIKSLATFNKPIVAGVQGTAVGLGVTILPLFDLVIASDKATFSTPYRKLGQIAEGAGVFTLSHIIGNPVTSELILGSRIFTADEALRAGLVTRVLWSDGFQVELLPSLRAMSEESSQSMEITKALLRHSLRKKIDAALESESYILVQHWCSTECQEAIKKYMDELVQ